MGRIKIDKIEAIGRIYKDFIVNGQLLMDYYFLDGSKYPHEVFKTNIRRYEYTKDNKFFI